MPPIPQEKASLLETQEMVGVPIEDDDIVISGMSGLFPKCNNVKEFSEKLYSKENLVKTDKVRWKYIHPELTEYCGTLPGLEKFDAQFFMVHYRLSNSMDAMSRKLLEHSYQAIFDAGMSPNEVSDKSVGVFIGTCLTETEKVCAYSHVGIGIVGCNRAMFSNRISYCLNTRGPSQTIDAACSGSMVCLEKAYQALRRGDCEAAIVGGANIHLHPQSCIHYGRIMKLNPDGNTKSFDKYADGQSPSECISVIFLQKAKHAKRIYATVCKAKTEFSKLDSSHFDKYGPYREPGVLSTFFNDFYNDMKVRPSQVEYVEAFGSAFPEADKCELEAIEDVFCKNREDPLFIGSIMSNMGYSQASTTMAGITKVCLAYHTGKIPANLNYQNPREDIDALREGRIRIITDTKPFSRSYTAINSMGLTGVNGHALLRGQYKPKNLSRYESKIPYLLTASGRQESAVVRIFDHLKSNPIDPEEIAMWHNIHKARVSKHLARGMIILKSNEANETVCLREKIDYYDDAQRPLWFIYSGMGSQWNGMGIQLLQIPRFAATIKRCHEVLKPKGVDLMYILTSDDKTIYDNILNSFVGIAAVQIGLTDILLDMGLVPDNIIGHSVGELGCAYADGCLTAEEMILSAYYRGLVSVQTPLIHGSLAAIGIGYEQVVGICPPEVDVACHNSPDSSTISGPSDVMREFVAKLMAQGIFAKEVPCSNIAYHSRYIKDAGPGLLNYLKDIIKEPKARSKRWLSTSVPQEQWTEPNAKYCSAHYLTNNLLSPVLFEETARMIPRNAVLLEVAPHGLLQAILKRYLPDTCTSIPLTRRGHADNILFLLEALGDLYMSGYSPDLSILYPKIEFPVSTETRSISHLLEWAHTEKWTLPVYVTADRAHAVAYDVTLSTHDDDHNYLRGHVIDDEILFPSAGTLVFVWDTLAMSMETTRRKVSVIFQNIHFHAMPSLSNDRLLRLSVEIERGTGKFEIYNENVLVTTGYIKAVDSDASGLYRKVVKPSEMHLTSNDVYRMLYERGFGYRGEFRSIQRENEDMTHGIISWQDNWVTFLDGMIQMNALRRNCQTLEQPRYIHRVHINIKEHDLAKAISPYKDTNALEANIFEYQSATRCGGVVIENIVFKKRPQKQRQAVLLKTLNFVPFNNKEEINVSTAINVLLQVVAENIETEILSAIDFIEASEKLSFREILEEVLTGHPNLKLNLNTIKIEEISDNKTKISNSHIVVLGKLIKNTKIHDALNEIIRPDTFVVVLEDSTVKSPHYREAVSMQTLYGKLVLGRWGSRSNKLLSSSVVSVTSSKELSSLHASRNNLQSDNRLVILTNYPLMDEIKDLVREWRKESQRKEIFVAAVDHACSQNTKIKEWPSFELAFNVLKNGVWGNDYFVPSPNTRSVSCNVTLNSAEFGKLKSLRWIEVPEPEPKNITVAVHFAALSYYDAKKATGDIPIKHNEISDQRYGMDFSGITTKGERVMGVVHGGAVTTRLTAEPSMLWPVPDHWSLEDAATVPLPYVHAFYCLGIKCTLIRGMSVFVHGGTGALGQAVISIALAHGCQVFTTVSDIKKKRFLRKIFPELPEHHIGNSRDETFADTVLGATEGEGCDIVISSAKGNLRNIAFNCCKGSGATLDLYQVHSKDNFIYGMYHLTKSRTYASSDFSDIFTYDNFMEMELLQSMMSEGIARGYVRPLSRVVYSPHETDRALRLLAASRHRGRVLLRLHGEILPAVPRMKTTPECSHLVLASNGEDVLAMHVVDMLLSRSATNVLLNIADKSRSNHFLNYKLKQWQNYESHVKTTYKNLTEPKHVQKLLQDCNCLGSIEGIYVVSSDIFDKSSGASLRSLVANLDDISRKLFSTINYFVVINKNTSVGRDICLKRTLDGLPAKMIQLQKINKFDEFGGDEKLITERFDLLGIQNSLAAIENGICSSNTIISACAQVLPEESLLDKVSQITGMVIEEDSDDNKTLEQLGLDNDRYHELCNILQKFDFVVLKKKASLLTLRELKAIQKKFENKMGKVTGLEILYSTVDTNELLATADLVFMRTAEQKSIMRDDEFDCNATYLVLIPGMEGHHGRFQLLCERLKCAAVVLQPGLDHPHETVSEMAARMVKVMLKKIVPKQRFYLLGYSFGVLVALEMALMLEEQGLEGVVFCVDASPSCFPDALETWLQEAGASDETSLQDALVQHMYQLMVGDNSQRLQLELKEATSWQDKVEAGVKALRDKVPHSVQYARGLVQSAHTRIHQARHYDSRRLESHPLRSKLVVLRSSSQPDNEPSDLGLGRFSKIPLEVYELSADHAHALQDLRCSNVVNRHLDQSIIDAFNKKNLCNTYLRNATTYTQFSADYD